MSNLSTSSSNKAGSASRDTVIMPFSIVVFFQSINTPGVLVTCSTVCFKIWALPSSVNWASVALDGLTRYWGAATFDIYKVAVADVLTSLATIVFCLYEFSSNTITLSPHPAKIFVGIYSKLVIGSTSWISNLVERGWLSTKISHPTTTPVSSLYWTTLTVVLSCCGCFGTATPVLIEFSLSSFVPYHITPSESIQNLVGSNLVSWVTVSLSVIVNVLTILELSDPVRVTVTVVTFPSLLLVTSKVYVVFVSLSGIV